MVLHELLKVIEEFEIKDLDFKYLTNDVLQFHKEAQGVEYVSDAMILIDGNLGVMTDHVLPLLKELDDHLRKFREWY